jgi:8-oxo-dGTP pyrophosphatase MutT (NUDIX family)
MISKVRAIIIDSEGSVLLGQDKNGVYRLPGGSVENGEDLIDALIRELKEELSYSVSSLDTVESLFKYGKEMVFAVIPHAGIIPDCSKDPDMEFETFHWTPIDQLPEPMDEDQESIIYKFLRILNSNEVHASLVEKNQGSKVILTDDGSEEFGVGLLRGVVNRATRSLRVLTLDIDMEKFSQALEYVEDIANKYLCTHVLIEILAEKLPKFKEMGYKLVSQVDSKAVVKKPLRAAAAELHLEVNGELQKVTDENLLGLLPGFVKGKNSKILYKKL